MAHLSLCTVCTGLLILVVLENFVATSSASSIRQSREPHHDHEHDDFGEIGTYLLEVELEEMREEYDFYHDPDLNITYDQVSNLVEIVFGRIDCEGRVEYCSKCQDDFTSDVFCALGVDPELGLDDVNFLRASPILLYGTYEMVSVCQAGPGGTNLSETAVMASLKMASDDESDETLSEADLEVILELIHDSYTETTYSECFNVESIFDEAVEDHEAGANDHELLHASQAVVAGLLPGHCIGEPTMPSPDEFTHAVFDMYASSGVIPEDEFAHILIDLGIGGDHGHDHEHDHARRRRDISVTNPKGRGIMKRATTLADDHEHHNHSHNHVENVTTTCFSSEELLDIHGVDHEAGISEAQFNELSPSLVQQILSGACAAVESEPSDITPAQSWGYGSLAVFIISLCAVIGGAVVPFMSEGFYDKAIQTMIALAVATLTGDAVLHLVPQALGLHAHDHGSEEAHTPTSPEMAYIWKCLLIELAIYIFFVFEQIANSMKCCGSSHSHSAVMEMSSTGPKMSPRSSFRKNVVHSESKTELANHEAKMGEDVEELSVEGEDCGIVGCNSVATMIILGDSLHNFGDGLAIGTAFTVSLGAGISTSLAVLCHELPHELGDLAVLLNQGMRLSTALLLNLMSACTAFIGAWIGIALGQTDAAREWIFAVVAGMFLYVGLVNMLPMLHNYDGKSNRGTVTILQNIGFLAGVAIILLIALYEDAISVSL